MPWANISHNGFARQFTSRRTVRNPGCTCSWCGGMPYRKGKPTDYLYEYGTEPESISCHTNAHEGLFCSKSCHDSYHS